MKKICGCTYTYNKIQFHLILSHSFNLRFFITMFLNLVQLHRSLREWRFCFTLHQRRRKKRKVVHQCAGKLSPVDLCIIHYYLSISLSCFNSLLKFQMHQKKPTMIISETLWNESNETNNKNNCYLWKKLLQTEAEGGKINWNIGVLWKMFYLRNKNCSWWSK